jgi:alpha-ketoglutaric semialdehyde dehydrogenase
MFNNMTKGKNYIGFNLSAKGNTTFSTFNPKTNKSNSQLIYEASTEEINEACDLANEAFKSFRNVPGRQRASFLDAIADEILALDTVLTDTYCKESGLPIGRAEGERSRTIGQLRMFANLVESDDWREPSLNSNDSATRKMLIPIGPVVVFGASNFPLAYSTAGGDTASALAAGNPVIVKSHPMHAETGELVSGAIIKAARNTNMPDGVFSNLNSSGIEVGKQLALHPKVKAIGFTGSIAGGRALYNLAATREEPIPVFAEMGSINPVIITQKALQSRTNEIANNYADSITMGVGQFCTNPGLILCLENDETNHFIELLGTQLSERKSHCMLHPNIHMAYVSKGDVVRSQEGVKEIALASNEGQENYAQASLVTVKGFNFIANPKLHQEVFGPFSMVVQCKNEQELISIINGLEGQLSGTIIAEEDEYSDLSNIFESLQNRVGRIVFNGIPTGVEVCDAMTHGGPYPASTDSRFTAVGIGAIRRWVRPFTYQGVPDELLPHILK